MIKTSDFLPYHRSEGGCVVGIIAIALSLSIYFLAIPALLMVLCNYIIFPELSAVTGCLQLKFSYWFYVATMAVPFLMKIKVSYNEKTHNRE